jgi:hypothetical protein
MLSHVGVLVGYEKLQATCIMKDNVVFKNPRLSRILIPVIQSGFSVAQ